MANLTNPNIGNFKFEPLNDAKKYNIKNFENYNKINGHIGLVTTYE